MTNLKSQKPVDLVTKQNDLTKKIDHNQLQSSQLTNYNQLWDETYVIIDYALKNKVLIIDYEFKIS